MFGYNVFPLGGAHAGSFNYNYSSNVNGRNLWDDLEAAGYGGEATINVIVETGVQVGSTSTSVPGITVDTQHSGKTINFRNLGTINGRGGAGGGSASGGGTGGKAFFVNGSFTGTINFTNEGEINGGGGGGGGGRVRSGVPNGCAGKPLTCQNTGAVGGGGGGAGYGNGANTGGGGGTSRNCGFLCDGCSSSCACSIAIGGNGGSGGGKGAAGSTGAQGSGCTASSGPGGGGAAGAAVDGDSLINFVVVGTINGSRIN